MRKVQIIALFDYIIALKDFIWAPFEYKVTGGEAVVAPPPKEDLDGAKIKIEIESPLVILPFTISSNDGIRVELGNFLMTNKFERKKHLGTQLETHNINVFTMTLNNTNIKTVRGGLSSPILHDLAINVGMELPVSSVAYVSFPQMKFVISVSRLDLSLDDVEYNFIYTMTMQTLQLITAANLRSTAYRAKLEAIKEDLPPTPLSPASSARKEQITNSKLPPEAVTMQVEVNIDVIALVLQSQKRSLVKFFISEILIGYTTRINFSSTIVVALGGILLEDDRDQSTSAIHKVILQPKSSDVKMLDLSYETYSPVPQPTVIPVSTTVVVPHNDDCSDSTSPTGDAPTSPGHEWDSSLFIHLRSIKVVTMYGFLMAVKDFIVAPISPSPTHSENTHERKSQPSRTKLMMEIASPQILIPASPQSADMIVVELGNIIASNEIVTKTNPSYEVNVISVAITNMNIKSIRNNLQYPFLHDVLLDVSVHEPLQNVVGIAKQKYIIRIKPVDFVLTDDDYRFYTKVFSGNFLNTNPISTLSNSYTNLPSIPASKEGVIDMDIDVEVQSLGLLIKREDGSSPLHAIASFQISTLRGALRSYPNSSFTAEVAMGDITLTDARSNTTSEFKVSINIEECAELCANSPIEPSATYQKERDRYFVEVMVSKLNIFFSPTAVAAIKDFFTSMYTTPIEESATPIFSSAQEFAEPTKPSPISFTLVLHGLKLLFLEDESNQNSRAVIGKIFGKVLYMREENLTEKYHIQSSKLQLFVDNVQASSIARNYVPIVNPCSIDIQYMNFAAEQNILISTSNLDAYLSYKDVKLVLKIVKNLNIYEEPNPNSSPQLSKNTKASSNNNNSTNTTSSLGQKKQQLSISSDMIKVTLINDLLGKYDIPFAQILAQSVATHVENWSTEIAVKCNLELEVIGFNRQTTVFEPIIDATPLVIEYTTGANPKKKLRLTSKYLMNISISDDVVNSIASVYTVFAPQEPEAPTLSAMLPPSPITKPSLLESKELIKESGEVYQTGYYLYWIANYTGEPIEYYVEEGKYAEWNSAKASVVHTVESGQKLPLRLSRSLFKRRDFHQSGWSLHISVRMVGSTRYTSGIVVNKIGEAFHEISWNNTTAVIACEVDWQKTQQMASKLVTIRTPLYVTNLTSIPLYLALHSPVTSYHYTTEAPLEPGDKFYVPLKYAQPETRTSVSVCPVLDGLTINWSEASFPFDGFVPMHYFVCVVKDLNHLPIRVVGKIEDIKSPTRHSTEVVLMPPLTMENLLCHNIQILFYNENKILLDVPSGESRPLYTYDAAKNLAVKISGIHGFTDNQINTLVNANTTPPRAVKQFPLTDTSDPANTKSLMIDVQFKDDAGAQYVSLSCACCIINNTLIPLYYQPSSYTGEENFAPGFDNKSHTLMYSFADLKVKAPDSNWSIPFSVNSIGGGVLAMNGKGSLAQYQLKIAITDGEKQFSKTRMIAIYSHFVLVNKTNAPLHCAQFFGNTSRSSVHLQTLIMVKQTLQPGQNVPFHWYDRLKPLLICASRDNYGWSTGFNPLEVGYFCIKMLALDNSQEYFVRVNVKDSDTSTTITFSDEDPALTPYIVENNTELPIKFYQKGYPHKKYNLPPAHRYPFTWDDFVGERILMVEFESVNLTIPFDINKIRDFKPIKYQNANNSILVYPSIKPEGPSRVLKFEKTRQEKREQDSVDELVLEVNMGGIGISLITTKPQKKELLYIHMQDILFIYTKQDCGQNGILLSVDDIQIDNQNLATNYPVMLMTVKQKDRPFLHMSNMAPDSDLDFYEYCGVTMQEMIVRIEDHILLNIMNFVTNLPLDKLTPAGKGSSTTQHQKKAFFKLFVLNPIKINLSFVISCQGFLDSFNKYPVIRVFVRALSASWGVLEDAPLFFNALALNNLYTTHEELKELLTQHYQSQAKNKMINMVGSANVLGNPVSLFNHISTGVVDFFFEPALGIMKSPKDFGKGLKKGTTSLIKRSIYGTSNSSAKFFGAVSQGVAQWSVDPEYLKEREKDNRKRAKNVGEGLVLGAQGLGKGFFHGVTGLLTKPIEGAMRDGAGGFAKGVAQGLVGVAVKPVSGVLDFASRTSEGISANVKLYKERKRIREPKEFPPV